MPLHQPLVQALSGFSPTVLKKGTLLFHGSRSDQQTDVAKRQLMGTRKWFSQFASEAVNYAWYANNPKTGMPHLWICELQADISAIHGPQRDLGVVQPAKTGHFSDWFANVFEEHANAIAGKPRAFVDMEEGGFFVEVLIPLTNAPLKVLDVMVLPDDHFAARRLARQLGFSRARHEADDTYWVD